MKRWWGVIFGIASLVGGFIVLPAPGVGAVGYTVDTTSDANLTACTATPGDCSLRGAINNANANGVADTITFDPTVFPGGSPATIAINSMFSGLVGFGDTIDGTGAGVIIDAVNVEPDPAAYACFQIQATGVTIKGLQITDCNPGVLILSGFNNTVGPNNVIYDNGTGIWNASTGTGNKIIGNMIGTTADGTAVNPSGANTTGVMAVGAGGLTIGGTGAGDGNIISGSVSRGVEIQGPSTTVQGNKIGTDASGSVDLGNGGDGVYVQGTAGFVTIGGATADARNVISGNGGNGVKLSNSGSNVSVQGNYIGTDATGATDLGNSLDGVLVEVGSKVIYQNVISGNDGAGVHLAASGNFVQGNLIGTTAAGTAALGNAGNGVFISTSQSNNSVGGSSSSLRNVISGNGASGVELASASTGNNIRGNYIGTDITGTASISNGGSGVKLDGAAGNSIGGSGAGQGNLISGNAINGIEFSSASNSIVYGNLIGTQADGITALANGSNGVLVTSANSNSIGSSGTYANTIAFNTGAGVWVQSGIGNSISGNSIHSNGGLGIDLSVIGVTVNDPGDLDIGGNNRQNFPVLSLARTDGSTLVVDGSLDSLASTTFGLYFYASDVCDGSSHGEGRTYLGFNSYMTGAGGNVAFSKTLAVSVPAGQVVTATATTGGSTSEFSACATVQQDSDMDGAPDVSDNCPAIPNADQANADGDAFGDACDACPATADPAACPDDDNDGFTDDAEALTIGTNAGYPCGYNSWPADLWDQPPFSANKITVQDLTAFIAPARRLGTSPGDANFSARWDLLPGKGIFSATINVQDMTAIVTLTPPMLNGARALNGPSCPMASQ